MPNDQTLLDNTLSYDSLAQAVSARFRTRPTLASVAQDLFSQALKSEYPALDVDLSKTTLNIPNWVTDKKGRRIDGYLRKSLLDIVTQSMTGKERWEDPQEHYLSVGINHNLLVDMQRVEAFLQVLPEAIVPALQQALVEYWSELPLFGDTRGRWLGNAIKFALLTRVTELAPSTPLDTEQTETLMQVINCPVKDERSAMYGQQCAQVFLVGCTLHAAPAQVVSLLAQILVTRRVNDREIVLLFGPSGAFKVFASLNDFADQEGARLTDRLLIEAVDIQPYETAGNVFVTLAQALLNNQLESLKSLEPLAGQDLAALEKRYEQLTELAPSIIDRSPGGDQQTRFLEVRDTLSDWLKRASGEDVEQYSRYVCDQAVYEQQSAGKPYNHDIESLEPFARQALHKALVAQAARQIAEQRRHEEPEETGSLDPDRIMVSQYRSNRSPFEVIDGDIHTQDYSIETVSLTQRSLKHLLGLPFILTTINYEDGSAVPSWITPEYLRTLIAEVDIGKAYPEKVKRQLLDDPSQRTEREKRYGQQLRVQLPMQALKLKIKGESGFSSLGYRYVAALMQPTAAGRYVDGREIVIGPLSFEPSLEQAHSDVEQAYWKPSGEVRNMFLIGPRPDVNYPNDVIVLYRPFYEESLIEFPSRYAFMEEVRSNTPRGTSVTHPDGTRKPQSLRDSILEWLEPDARATYVSNGFKDPDTGYSIDFLFFLKGTGLWTRKASHPLLSKTAFDGDPLPHLYEANAKIVIRGADEKTVSGDEFRWERFNAARWALANAVFPFVEGPWAVVGAMVALAQNLKEVVEAEKQDDHVPAQTLLVQLLVNLGVVLLTHGLNSLGSRLISRVDELSAVPASVPRARPGARASAEPGIRFKDAADGARFLEKADTVVDFSTSMSGDAQALLERLIKNTLQGQGPVQAAPLNGIRVVEGRWFARVPARLRGQGWAEVSPAGGENVFLLDGQGKPISWLQLRHNGRGLWEVAPEFRVRGGGLKKDPGAKRSLADMAKKKAADLEARDNRLLELSARLPAVENQLEPAVRLIESATQNRKPVVKAVGELLEKINTATDEQRPSLVKLLQKVQQPRLSAADLAVEQAVLNYVQVQQERLVLGREILDVYLQAADFYSKEIVYNLKEVISVQSRIYDKFRGLLVENPISGLAGEELFPAPDLEPGANEWLSLGVFEKEQRWVLNAQARLIEASGALESTINELEGFAASSAKALRQELLEGQAVSRHWRLRELECMKRALSARPTATDSVFQSTARAVLRATKVTEAANSQWEILEYDGYTAFERIEVLESALQQYDRAISMGRLLESAESPPVPQDFLQRFLSRLGELRTSAQQALSAQILDEDLPQAQAFPEVLSVPHKKPLVKRARKPTKRVFKSRNQETLVGDFSAQSAGESQEISISDPLGGKSINYYKPEGQENWQERLEPPAPPVKPNPGLLNSLTAKGKRQLDDVDAFINWVKKPTNSAPEPVSLQEMLENRARELEKTASEISQGLAALSEQERKPATVEVRTRLGEQSARLIEEARLLRIKSSRDLPPSAGRFQYLLEQGEVSVAAPVWTDKSTAKGADFLLEYAILDEKSINVKGEKEVVWYAHFHCPAKNTRLINKGHLKLKALRFKTYQDQLSEARNAAQVRAVKSADINQKFADQYFFKTAP
ncbi:dermonecrotic toxin domain-containing protein [Pseudomonas fluorescens]|uniref:Dermonecrotic toxin N-terminal domain-containing protein n=1 Tax=Pseudomonas fluorescens TaxID=294 RepID=A0A5E7C8G9_PSEFL|nr:DUF6543 domain-containing protein [Pseudomonas fluorescens]VVN92263.1 hypothetical protein PS723_01966 [Pseudomonas fluorescens]